MAGARSAAKRVVFALLRYSGVLWVARLALQSRGLTVLAYHDPDPATFASHLEALASRYSIVSLSDLLEALRSGSWALPPRALLITFDDGWAGNRSLLGSFEERGVRPVVFLTTSVVGTSRHFWWTGIRDARERDRLKELPESERDRRLAALGYDPSVSHPDRQALSLEEVREMSTAVDLGAHTRTHPVLSRVSDERAREEIEGSAADVERIAGSRPAAFAYPNGDASDREVRQVRESGFECAFTMRPGVNDAGTDPFLLRRIGMDDAGGVTDALVRASSLHGAFRRA